LKKRLISVLLISSFLWQPLYAAELPDLGDVSSESLSDQDAKRISEAVYIAMRRSGDLLDDPEVSTYINQLGQRLVRAANAERYDFRFYPIRDGSINAFAVPGGFVGVNTGLLIASQHESEVAAVLAHEIAHVTQQHAARLQFAMRATPWLVLSSIALGILAAKSGNGNAAMAAMVGGQGLAIQKQLDFTQSFESEADRIGMQTLKNSGFDPAAMPTFFGRLQQKERYLVNAAPAFLRTHPVTSRRISESESRLGDYSYRQIADSAGFQLIREKVKVLQYDNKAEALDQYRRGLAEKRYASLAAQYYGLAMAEYLNNLQPQALQSIQNARTALKKGSPILDNLEAQILAAQGKADAAIALLRKSFASYPGHRALMYTELDVLLSAKRNQDAIRRAQQAISLYPDDPELYQRAARAYATAGNSQRQYQMQSEYYAYNLDFVPAIDMMQRAISEKGSGDFYVMSAMEARLRELKRLDELHK
jgi:predicted Zn-dependent protease